MGIDHFNAHHSQESGPHARHYLCPLALISSPYECQATKVQLKYPQNKLIALSVLCSSVFSITNSLYDFKRKIKISTTGNNSFLNFFSTHLIYLLYVGGGVCMPWCLCGGQRTTWVLRTEPRPLGLVASTSTYQVISLARE